jgi:hypothetical protein
MDGLRFCAYQYQHLPLDALRGRWRGAERAGFDVLWNCDTVVEPDRPRHTMFDGHHEQHEGGAQQIGL